MSLVMDIGGNLIFSILEILLGCLIGFGLIKALGGKNDIVAEFNRERYLAPVLASLIGMAFPMDLFGIAPIMLSAFLVGIRFPLVVPMMASNFVFNMLVPFTEVGFSWKTAWLRIAMAFFIGLAAGFTAGLMKIEAPSVVRGDVKEMAGSNKYFSFVNRYLFKAGIFLIAGVIAEVIFKKYFFYDLFNLIDITGATAAIYGFIKEYNVASPVFMINMTIFYMVMNLKTLSGVIMLFKWKGSVGFYLYNAAWVVLLSIVNIFVP